VEKQVRHAVGRHVSRQYRRNIWCLFTWHLCLADFHRQPHCSVLLLPLLPAPPAVRGRIVSKPRSSGKRNDFQTKSAHLTWPMTGDRIGMSPQDICHSCMAGSRASCPVLAASSARAFSMWTLSLTAMLRLVWCSLWVAVHQADKQCKQYSQQAVQQAGSTI
jgi:hypothetical protein